MNGLGDSYVMCQLDDLLICVGCPRILVRSKQDTSLHYLVETSWHGPDPIPFLFLHRQGK